MCRPTISRLPNHYPWFVGLLRLKLKIPNANAFTSLTPQKPFTSIILRNQLLFIAPCWWWFRFINKFAQIEADRLRVITCRDKSQIEEMNTRNTWQFGECDGFRMFGNMEIRDRRDFAHLFGGVCNKSLKFVFSREYYFNSRSASFERFFFKGWKLRFRVMLFFQRKKKSVEKKVTDFIVSRCFPSSITRILIEVRRAYIFNDNFLSPRISSNQFANILAI